MTIKQNVFSGGAVGADVTVASSGGASGDAFSEVQVSAGSMTFSTDRTFKGTRSAKISGTGSGTAYGAYAMAGKNVAAREYLWLDAATTTDTPIIWVGAGSTQVARLQLISNGRVRAFTTAGTTVWTSANVPATGQWVRFEMRVVVGTSTTDGEIHGAYYLGDSTTPVEEFHLTGQNLGTVNVGTIRFGKAATSSYASTMYLAAVKCNDATLALVGPVPATPPSVDASVADAVIIDATTSVVTGTPTYSIAQSSGPSLTPVSIGSGRWRVARSAEAARVYDVSVTDEVGTATQAITVARQVAASSYATIGRRRMVNGVLK